MTDATTVSATEHGLLRVFFLEDALAQQISVENGNGAFWDAIGSPENAQGDFQMVATSFFTNGLSGFLQEGYGISEKDVFEHAATLDQFDGHAVILRSSAFTHRPVTLVTDGAAKLVATFAEDGLDTAFPTPIETLSSMGVITPPAKKVPSDAAMSGRVATIALLVMAFLVWLMIKVAG